nr:heparanase-like isoform X1 [Cherax quadricarinatus]
MGLKVMLQVLVYVACAHTLFGVSSVHAGPSLLPYTGLHTSCTTYSSLLGCLQEACKDLKTLLAAADTNHIMKDSNTLNVLVTRAQQWATKFQRDLRWFTKMYKLREPLVNTVEREADQRYLPNPLLTSPDSVIQLQKTRFTALQPYWLASKTFANFIVQHKKRTRFPAQHSHHSQADLALLEELLVKVCRMEEAGESNKVSVAEVDVAAVVREVPATFLSVALGPRLIQHKWLNFNTSSPLVLTLTRALAPAVLRMGGSAANFLTYDPASQNVSWPASPSHNLEQHTTSVTPSLQVLQDTANSGNEINYENNHTKAGTDIPYIKNAKWNRYQYPWSQRGWSSITEVADSSHSSAGTGHLSPEENVERRRCNSDFASSTFTNFTMTRQDWDQLIVLAEATGMKLLFDVNQFYRGKDGSWDPTNARLLMQAAAAKDAHLIWQLGNEPNAYTHNFGFNITGERSASDHLQLYRELQHHFPGQAPIVAPDITRPKQRGQQQDHQGLGETSLEFLRVFLGSLKINLTAVTWHQYYMDGRTAQVEDFLSPSLMDQFKWQITQVVSVRDQFSPGTPIWLTETSSAYGGGARGLSDAFVAGFLWLDKLGLAAALHGSGGVELVARETLYESCYALIATDLVPNPDYWLSVLYKRLVGGRVLSLRLRGTQPTTRLYAHCLRNLTGDYTPGSVVVFGMNLSKEPAQVTLSGHLATSPLLQYLLQPPDGNLQSRQVMLNGRVLDVTSDGQLPDLMPSSQPPGTLQIPATSLGFWVLPHAQAPACV